MGGLWGFKSSVNRNVANQIYELLNSKLIIQRFAANGIRARDQDQKFLSIFVFKLINHLSMTHDSYHCNYFLNSQPFPTRRKGNCFVGSIGFCDEKAPFYLCPVECRPREHMDWVNC